MSQLVFLLLLGIEIGDYWRPWGPWVLEKSSCAHPSENVHLARRQSHWRAERCCSWTSWKRPLRLSVRQCRIEASKRIEHVAFSEKNGIVQIFSTVTIWKPFHTFRLQHFISIVINRSVPTTKLWPFWMCHWWRWLTASSTISAASKLPSMFSWNYYRPNSSSKWLSKSWWRVRRTNMLLRWQASLIGRSLPFLFRRLHRRTHWDGEYRQARCFTRQQIRHFTSCKNRTPSRIFAVILISFGGFRETVPITRTSRSTRATRTLTT